jgi:predicted RNA-binding Zn-ribbon protein involved in translation (DUF1610 family)
MATDPDSEPTLTRSQRFFLRLLPSRAAEIERQSREWMVICPNCGFERSVWERGGVRYKAKGGQRVRTMCPSCGERGWHRLERRPS